MKTEEHERAAELMAKLLRDPSARASFRRNPAEMCRDHGLEEVAAELAGRDGALESLDMRESRSSVAGVLIAAAAEGVAFFAFVDHAHADGGLSPDAAKIVALTRPQIAAVVPEGNGGGGAPAEVVAQADATPGAAHVDGPAAAGGTPEPPPEPVPDAVPEVPAPAATPDLLHDPRLTLTDSAETALAAAGPTSRTGQIVTSLLERHTIAVGAIAPDGSFTITMVDGAPVDSANIAARDLAEALTALDPSLRPTAVGTPWPIGDPAFYSYGAHQHHIEVGFGEPPPKPAPAVVEAPAPAPAADPPAAPAADPAPAAPADSASAGGKSGSTGGFAALAGRAPRSGHGTLSVGAVSSTSAAAPGAPATPEAAAAAGAAAELPTGVDGPAGPKALAALAEARKFMGTPYKWGGEDPSTGFDCSGLMQWSYKQVGISIGRVTTQQIHDGVAVDRAHLQAGDMVFFQDSSGYVHHVGMYIGDHKFLHAPHTGDVVKISNLDEPYYRQQFAGGRRVDTSAPVDAPAGLRPAAVGAAPADAAARGSAAAPVGTGGFAVLEAAGKKGAPPRATVQVLKAVEKPAVKPAAATPAASGAAPLDADQLAAAAAGGYPGDNAKPEEYAAWMAAAAQKAGLPPQLPIMAALTESGMRNLSGGDRDSIGFFQMRTSIWNQGEYAGYGQNPDLQLKWFITQALAIKEQRLARGETSFVADPKQWGLWIADVERPQEDYRGRYQTHLEQANQLLGTS